MFLLFLHNFQQLDITSSGLEQSHLHGGTSRTGISQLSSNESDHIFLNN